jgi:chromosome partitioning protein
MIQTTNTIYNLLHKEKVIPTKIKENLDIIPSSFDLSVWEEEHQPAKESRLKIGLKNIAREYDFVIIDSPPSLGKLTQSVLTATDYVLIPMKSEQYSVDGMVRFFDLTGQIKEYLNGDLKILGIFITMFEANTNLHNIIKKRIKKSYENILLNIEIRKSIKIPESIFANQELSIIHPKSNGSVDYKNLVKIILKEIKSHG